MISLWDLLLVITLLWSLWVFGTICAEQIKFDREYDERRKHGRNYSVGWFDNTGYDNSNNRKRGK